MFGTQLALVRVESGGGGVLGRLFSDGSFVCWILELPWRENRVGLSCIPTGVYSVRKWSSLNYPRAYLVDGVVGRSRILIHKGNSVLDSRGCLLVGSDWNRVSTGSLGALDRLKKAKLESLGVGEEIFWLKDSKLAMEKLHTCIETRECVNLHIVGL